MFSVCCQQLFFNGEPAVNQRQVWKGISEKVIPDSLTSLEYQDKSRELVTAFTLV